MYGAVNIRTERRVALKWILPALATSPEVLQRFRREALAAGRINHPNVVTIFDVVEHQGSACLVMELLAGETLADRMANWCVARDTMPGDAYDTPAQNFGTPGRTNPQCP